MRRAVFTTLLAFGCALGPAPAADGPPAGLDRAAYDKALLGVLNRGADLYNAGDSTGSLRLFEGALRLLRPALAQRPELQQAVDRGLADARGDGPVEERAFRVREVLSRLRAQINPPPSGTARKAPAKTADAGLSEEEQEVLDLTNAERRRAGLPPLRANAKLTRAARAHSANMARQGRLDHTLDGRGPGERMRDVGYRHAGWGENVAAGQRTPAEALATWLNSAGHRANILGAPFRDIGIGIAVGDGTRYFTQVFGTPAE